MKILTFHARRFRWQPYEQTLPDTGPAEPGKASDAVVAFVHVEGKDLMPEREKSVFRQTLKHLKWVANKGGLRTIVLHSFTHLGGQSAAPEEARLFLERLAERLQKTGYTVYLTPFGWLCEWELHIYGYSMAKVWKDI